MEKVQVSVCMPVYNGASYLRESIDSILTQTFQNFEIIIVDDASLDSTPEILKDYSTKDHRIKIFRNEKNLNIGGTLNKAINEAQGKFIARMDSDDISLPNRLKEQYEFISSHPNVAVVGGDIILISETGKELHIRHYPSQSDLMKKAIFRYLPFAHPATMFRKDVFIDVGGYDPNKSPSEDMDLWIKIGAKYDFGSISHPILKYRTFEKSSSNKKLRRVEMNTIKMRWNAFSRYGYRPSLFDIFYNIGQIITLWIMPTKFRITLFNFLREKNFI